MDNEILDYYQDPDGKKHPQTVAQAVAYKSDAYPHANNVDEALQAIACNVGGSVVASGKIGDGYYIKYADGTMIQRKTETLTVGASGTVAATVTITTPIPFSDPSMTIILTNKYAYYRDVIWSASGVTHKSFVVTYTKLGDPMAVGDLVRFDYIAIGRWYDQPTSEYHPMPMHSNPNLLINSNFKNPINQRGKTTYTGINSYTIDRWKNGSSSKSVTVGADGLIFGTIIQPIENGIDNGVYTLSIKTADNLYTYTLGYQSTSVTKSENGFSVALEPNGVHTNVSITNDNDIAVQWLKLEPGAVATTLNPRLNAEEMAICRYFYRFLPGYYGAHATGANQYVFVTSLDINGMRVTPQLDTSRMVCASCTIEISAANNFLALTSTTANKYTYVHGYITADSEIY